MSIWNVALNSKPGGKLEWICLNEWSLAYQHTLTLVCCSNLKQYNGVWSTRLSSMRLRSQNKSQVHCIKHWLPLTCIFYLKSCQIDEPQTLIYTVSNKSRTNKTGSVDTKYSWRQRPWIEKLTKMIKKKSVICWMYSIIREKLDTVYN